MLNFSRWKLSDTRTNQMLDWTPIEPSIDTAHSHTEYCRLFSGLVGSAWSAYSAPVLAPPKSRSEADGPRTVGLR